MLPVVPEEIRGQTDSVKQPAWLDCWLPSSIAVLFFIFFTAGTALSKLLQALYIFYTNYVFSRPNPPGQNRQQLMIILSSVSSSS